MQNNNCHWNIKFAGNDNEIDTIRNSSRLLLLCRFYKDLMRGCCYCVPYYYFIPSSIYWTRIYYIPLWIKGISGHNVWVLWLLYTFPKIIGMLSNALNTFIVFVRINQICDLSVFNYKHRMNLVESKKQKK